MTTIPNIDTSVPGLTFFGPQKGIDEWKADLIRINKLHEIELFYGYAVLYEFLLNERDKNELHSHV